MVYAIFRAMMIAKEPEGGIGLEMQKWWLLVPVLTIALLLITDGLLIGVFGWRDNYAMLGKGQEDKAFPSFHARELGGETLTEAVFAGKTTVVCIWTAKDAACHSVLPELSALSRRLPDDVQILGLVGDLKDDAGAEEVALASQIWLEAQQASLDCEPAGAASEQAEAPRPVPQLMVNDDFLPLLSHVHTVPTVCFVDAQGNLVGQPVFGTDMRLVEQELHRILELDSPRSRALRQIQASILYR